MLEKLHAYWKGHLTGLILAVLFSAAAAWCIAHPPGFTYWFTYEQMTGQLEQLTYDERTDVYTKPYGSFGTIELFRDEKKIPWSSFQVMYLPVGDAGAAECNIQFLDGKKNVIAGTHGQLVRGRNIFAIPDTAFRFVTITFFNEEELSFRLPAAVLAQSSGGAVTGKLILSFALILAAVLTALSVSALRFKDAVGSFFAMCSTNMESFVSVLSETISMPLPESFRRMGRRILLFILFGYSYVANIFGQAWEFKYSPVQIWTAGLLITLTCGLCGTLKEAGEGRNGSRSANALKWTMFSFVLLTLASDVLVNKRYRYSPYGVLVCGVLLLFTWRRMEDRGALFTDVKRGFETLWLLLFTVGLFFHPLQVGVHYRGAYADAPSLGMYSLFAMLFFLDDFYVSLLSDQKDRPARRSLTAAMSLAAAVVAASVVWASQELLRVVLLARLLLIAGGFCLAAWLGNLIRACHAQGTDKVILNRRLLLTAGSALAGVSAGVLLAWGCRKILYTLPYRLNTQDILSLGEQQVYDLSLKAAVLSKGWKWFFSDAAGNTLSYLSSMNLTGHYFAISMHGAVLLPENSIIMNAFRYGLPAGVLYAAALLTYFGRSVVRGIRKRQFLMTGLAVLTALLSFTQAVEHPLISLNYMMLAFGMVRMMME